MDVRPLSECTVDDLKRGHAFVYGRCRIWHSPRSDSSQEMTWSRWAWWKALFYPHRGKPSFADAWGIYAGSEGYTGCGDAQITHFARMFDVPRGAPTGESEW